MLRRMSSLSFYICVFICIGVSLSADLLTCPLPISQSADLANIVFALTKCWLADLCATYFSLSAYMFYPTSSGSHVTTCPTTETFNPFAYQYDNNNNNRTTFGFHYRYFWKIYRIIRKLSDCILISARTTLPCSIVEPICLHADVMCHLGFPFLGRRLVG